DGRGFAGPAFRVPACKGVPRHAEQRSCWGLRDETAAGRGTLTDAHGCSFGLATSRSPVVLSTRPGRFGVLVPQGRRVGLKLTPPPLLLPCLHYKRRPCLVET